MWDCEEIIENIPSEIGYPEKISRAPYILVAESFVAARYYIIVRSTSFSQRRPTFV